jgi:hypothetical protein
MGEPASEWDRRIDQLIGYQVNAEVLAATGNPEVKFLHCLPALHNRETEVGRQIYDKRGLEALEVTDEVFESPHSVVWQPNIEWHDVPAGQFAGFAEPGWGKIACHFLIRSGGPGRAVVSYECRTATTDPGARSSMARYWWIIRLFVGHIMRATLRTIRANAKRPAQSG